MLKLVPRQPRSESTARWTFAFFRPYRLRVGVLALLALAEIALRALAPWPLEAIVDEVIGGRHPTLPVLARLSGPDHRVGLLTAVVLAGLALQLAHELVLLAHSRVQARLAQRVVFDLRSRLFSHFQYLSLSHHAQQSTADAVYRLDADAGCLENLLLRGLFPSLFSALTLVVMFAILLRLDTTLAIVSMIVVPFLYLSLRLYMRRMEAPADRAKALESDVVARVYESLSSIRLVKAFAREEYEVSRFHGAARAANEARLRVSDQESLFSFFVGAITLAGSSLVLGLGGVHVIEGQLSVGSLLVVVTYLGFVYGPMSAIATTTGSLHGALASAKRVRDVLALSRETDAAAPGIESRRIRGEVRFEGVSFSYGPGRPVLDEVTFTAHPGETVALVGPSGAGKSTLVSLLGRLYEPTSGHVLIDGVDARRYSLRALREQVAIVPQDAVLLGGSIADNILYGRLDATDHEVVLAARNAYTEEFVAKLRRGFDTPIGEAGGQLSGGQRQRLSIARAFLKDAPILILDEPTASLDSVSERAVLAALARLHEGRTTFVIAHRLSTVRSADRILVLDGGRIAAQGRHEELLQASPLYQRLCAGLALGDQAADFGPSAGGLARA